MKTTIEIADALLIRAKRHAKRAGKPLRALVEEGLRRMLDDATPRTDYTLPDHSVGQPGAQNPLEHMSWPDLRDQIYGGR